MSPHYLGKRKPQKLRVFFLNGYIALPTNTETRSNYQLVAAVISKISQ